jgi:hypothetical protein
MLLLNYKPVLRQPTGIGVYAEGVLPALRQLPHLLVPGGGEAGGQARLRRLAWSQGRLPQLARRAGASLIFTPAPEGYLGPQRIPQLVMVHDLRPISHPELSLQGLYFRLWVPPLLRGCRHVLTNSHYTAAQIQRCTGLAAERISVIPLGYDSQAFRPQPQPHQTSAAAGAGVAVGAWLLGKRGGQELAVKVLANPLERFGSRARGHVGAEGLASARRDERARRLGRHDGRRGRADGGGWRRGRVLRCRCARRECEGRERGGGGKGGATGSGTRDGRHRGGKGSVEVRHVR